MSIRKFFLSTLPSNNSADVGQKESFFPADPVRSMKTDAPGCDPALFELGIPILGVCYGMQLIAKDLGGRVEPAHEREYGHGTLKKIGTSALLDGIQKFG